MAKWCIFVVLKCMLALVVLADTHSRQSSSESVYYIRCEPPRIIHHCNKTLEGIAADLAPQSDVHIENKHRHFIPGATCKFQKLKITQYKWQPSSVHKHCLFTIFCWNPNRKNRECEFKQLEGGKLWSSVQVGKNKLCISYFSEELHICSHQSLVGHQ